MNEGPEIHVGDFVLRERNQRVPKSQIESLNVQPEDDSKCTSKSLSGCRNVVDDLCGESAVPQKLLFCPVLQTPLKKQSKNKQNNPKLIL